MTDYILTMLDTTGIQHYIFNSNRLQENIGASELVHRATTVWAFAALKEAGLNHNINQPDQPDWGYRPGFQIETAGEKTGEVVYAGGGNLLLIFQDIDDAKEFTSRLTRRILEHAPGLTVVARHLPFDWGKNDLAEKREELIRKLAAHKQSRLPSAPTLGLSVSATCQSTGLPAVQDTSVLRPNETPARLVSRETVAKLRATEDSNKRLQLSLGKEAGRLSFPYDIDNLGRLQGEESYVAVVHADGNRMGEHLRNATSKSPGNRSFIEAVRSFSTRVDAASLAALKDVVRRVRLATEAGDVPSVEGYLPFRPLVFGGDDVTFLCNGQIGVSLAAAYLEAFERETDRQDLKDMHACAGVTIIKMHYPFARAYSLSEGLIKSAKGFVRWETDGDCSALDWHYATSGLSGSLNVIREREYTADNGPLTMRPVRLRLQAGDQSGRYWRGGLENVIVAFQQDAYWAGKRNKVIGLREPLRNGKDAVSTYLRNFELRPLPLLSTSESTRSGWQKDGEQERCVYFDAVELFSQYIPLPTQEVQP